MKPCLSSCYAGNNTVSHSVGCGKEVTNQDCMTNTDSITIEDQQLLEMLKGTVVWIVVCMKTMVAELKGGQTNAIQNTGTMCSEGIERTVEELQSNIESVVNGRDYAEDIRKVKRNSILVHENYLNTRDRSEAKSMEITASKDTIYNITTEKREIITSHKLTVVQLKLERDLTRTMITD